MPRIERAVALKVRLPFAQEPSFGPPGCNLFVFHLPDDGASGSRPFSSERELSVSLKVLLRTGLTMTYSSTSPRADLGSTASLANNTNIDQGPHKADSRGLAQRLLSLKDDVQISHSNSRSAGMMMHFWFCKARECCQCEGDEGLRWT